MAIVDRATLKTYFETGDKPSQAEFADWLDSILTLLDDGVYGWQKATINYDDFQPSGFDEKYINCFFVSAGFQVSRIIIVPVTTFSGGTISDSYIQLFDSTDSQPYQNSDVDTFSAITNNSGRVSPAWINTDSHLIDISSGSNVRILLGAYDGADGINDLTQGQVDIYYRLDKVPF